MRSGFHLTKESVNPEDRNSGVLGVLKWRTCEEMFHLRKLRGGISQLYFHSCFHFFVKSREAQKFRGIEKEEETCEWNRNVSHDVSRCFQSMLANTRDIDKNELQCQLCTFLYIYSENAYHFFSSSFLSVFLWLSLNKR